MVYLGITARGLSLCNEVSRWLFSFLLVWTLYRRYWEPTISFIRSIPEASYNILADILNFACIVFESTMRDYLFTWHSEEDYNRDEDHLMYIMEYQTSWSQNLYHALAEQSNWPPYEPIEFMQFLKTTFYYEVYQLATTAESRIYPW